ncbi:uncharacterized protein N7483_002424 [Penicillium malachiteum]|uniref:uncharacterized protein n=1 Tax=Penicillium malachiteum TaxID=1324776 RepID=UPI002549241A|nr:uncharacterized protein N7483_002424 [Penicillium malachiteum]KAJ5737299.1 hypothetical protein N7483_002424 [Penicillium malachiteum]
MDARATLSHDDYTVGWICALPLEMAAAKVMMDTIHPSLPSPSTDQNTYILGNIGEHKIVIACLPGGAYGNVSAATVAMQLLSSFHSIRFGLMVGIGGGIPSSNADIRLGDIVVSQPRDTFGGVIQYDLGKVLHDGQFQRTGMLNRPPKVLLTAFATLEAHHLTEDSRVVEFISNIYLKTTSRKATTFTRPAQEHRLYQAEYNHGAADTCVDCDRSKLTQRSCRDHDEPVIHYGLIASANQVVKDGRRRDQLAQDLGVHCVEMEAAGLMNDFPCVVIRGICDYADSHKNEEWQGYAAAVAAAYAKELLLIVPINQIGSTPTARDILEGSVDRFKVPVDLTAVPVIENFVGRQDELDHLWQYLNPTKPQSRKVAILHGLGGIGKHSWQSVLRDNIKMISALSFGLAAKIEARQALKNEAANDDELEQRARDVLRWLEKEGNSRWLIILDNIDQYSPVDSGVEKAYDIGKFFPIADHGSILITSRLPRLSELGESFPINKLHSTETIQLLLKNSGLSKSNTGQELEGHPDTHTLADRLDGLPLAIDIAAAFMRETGTRITHHSRPLGVSTSNRLETRMISFQEIQNRDPIAAEILLLLARFDNRDVWYELVKNASHSSNIPVWLERAISSELEFKVCMKPLIEFSLLHTTQQEGSYTMHPVVQDWCFHLASKDGNLNPMQLLELAIISVGYTVPHSSDRNYTELQRRLVPHANILRNGQFSANNIAIWGGLHGLGHLYSDQGKLKEAEEISREGEQDRQNAAQLKANEVRQAIEKLST